MNEKDKALRGLYRALTVAIWTGLAVGLLWGIFCAPCIAPIVR